MGPTVRDRRADKHIVMVHFFADQFHDFYLKINQDG